MQICNFEENVNYKNKHGYILRFDSKSIAIQPKNLKLLDGGA